jgi:protein phosphatase
VVSPDTILEALQVGDPQDSADRLVELALRAGGPDNVTCIVADVIDVPYGDDAPVLDGAAGGNRGQRDPDPSSPAARAAAMRPRPELEDTVEDEPVRPRRRWRFAIVTLLVLAALGGGAYGLWTWTQAQYFVGADGEQVGIYRGVNTAIGPVHLYSLADTADMRLSDLVPVAQQGVRDGITAQDRADVDRILANLADQLKPLCTPAPTPTPTPTPSPRGTTRPTAGRTATPTPTPTLTTPPAASPSPPDGDEGCRR